MAISAANRFGMESAGGGELTHINSHRRGEAEGRQNGLLTHGKKTKGIEVVEMSKGFLEQVAEQLLELKKINEQFIDELARRR